MYTKKHEFWHDELCLDLVDSNPSTKVKLYHCHSQGGNQKWGHDRVSPNDSGATTASAGTITDHYSDPM